MVNGSGKRGRSGGRDTPRIPSIGASRLLTTTVDALSCEGRYAVKASRCMGEAFLVIAEA